MLRQSGKILDVRLPLEGHLDLTYRCNNNCRHCWLRMPPGAPDRDRELSFHEISNIVDQARALGTRRWSISGGEPMLRPDFPEIFDYLTGKAVSYTLNTNGTLITPEIARLLTRKGTKMVALYGATPETYDHVTRHPGGFEKVMQGFRYLKEAGAGFIVQLIPMRSNWHEWEKMQDLARSLSKHWRVGAPWLYLSSCHDPERNAEIARQRLDPREVVELDQPDMSYKETDAHEYEHEESKMTESKKAWVEPELIVLVRSKPEEAVLGACKVGGGGGSASAQSDCLTSGAYPCNNRCDQPNGS